MADEVKRKNVTLRLAPETVANLKKINDLGYYAGRVVDDLVASFVRHAGLDESEGLDDSKKF